MSLHPLADKRARLADAAALVTDGAVVALGGGLSARLPMALVRELIRQGRHGLHLVGSAHSIDVDLLVAAGAARRCEESYVGFEQDLGLAPAYRRAAEQGTIEVAESCCATILAQLRAAEMGLPFLPVRGVRGSDIVSLHPEYTEITCPFTGETLVAVPPLAALALGLLVRGARPAWSLAALPLFALAWAWQGSLAGEIAATALTALACVALAERAGAPRRRAGRPARARPNRAAGSAPPPA